MERKYFEGFEGLKVPYLFFESERGEKFKNNIIIFHGVTEPIDRYEEFGKFLSANGYNVFVPEIRGHGELKTSEVCEFGKKGIKAVFEDINLFFKEELMPKGIKAENTTIFGHSMGALMGMKWVIENNYKYFILSGFSVHKKLSVFFGKMATGIEKLLFFKKKSFLNKEFKKYNDNFKPNLTKFDWLTRDENEVKKYEESEFCGYPISPGVFNGIVGMMGFINRNYKKVRNDANMLVIYGTEDKAMDIEYVNKMLETLKKKKRRINVLENKKGRHESLNEINKYEIYDEILKWLNEREK